MLHGWIATSLPFPSSPLHCCFSTAEQSDRGRFGDGCLGMDDVWYVMGHRDLHERSPAVVFPVFPACEGLRFVSRLKPTSTTILDNWPHLVRSLCLTSIPCRLRREGPILRGPCARHGILSIMLEAGRVTMQCSVNWGWWADGHEAGGRSVPPSDQRPVVMTRNDPS